MQSALWNWVFVGFYDFFSWCAIVSFVCLHICRINCELVARWCRPLKEKKIPCQHYSTSPYNQCTIQLNPYYYRRELLHCPNPLGNTSMRHFRGNFNREFKWSAFTYGRTFRIVAIPIFKAHIGPTFCLLIHTIPHKILLVFPQQEFNRLVYVFTWQL